MPEGLCLIAWELRCFLAFPDFRLIVAFWELSLIELLASLVTNPEVGAFYWTVLAPDIVNPEREEQVSL
jgi:hypothetical protein